ncbi:hypothetical protein EOA75_18035 [Mesorhizobium sp. M1A.F.Ca.IN.022.07.1.1]|nr:hypothetical protein EOA75_18035 [Mesorhizobium sp. M1A.F.Ca.IN.022.07.1.1]RWM65823.1 MAG: hypothetical protein EOR82_30495 [Mesorhizobium sp.]RWM89252.1 MAG: hypothetical protein EOR86_29900 [Mesorhizobium sp.]TJV54658.1 MAG: hypothetical protein E5X82_30670 [Mesorhizobium sp.]
MAGSGFDFVGANIFEAARLATEHLIKLGHRRIAFLGGEPASSIRNDRLAGYFAALNMHGIEFEPQLCTAGLPSRANHRRHEPSPESRPPAHGSGYLQRLRCGILHAGSTHPRHRTRKGFFLGLLRRDTGIGDVLSEPHDGLAFSLHDRKGSCASPAEADGGSRTRDPGHEP